MIQLKNSRSYKILHFILVIDKLSNTIEVKLFFKIHKNMLKFKLKHKVLLLLVYSNYELNTIFIFNKLVKQYNTLNIFHEF